MKHKLKNIRDQVMVITGGSSGIGLTTARMAAENGALVVVAAREENALAELTDEMNKDKKRMAYVVADVSKEEDVRKIAACAIAEFGRIDTWVNNAAVSIYGKIEDVPMEDAKRLFDIDFWGVVYGSRVAIENMKTSGGALINIGSVLSDRAIPLQGMYSAAKHAVKAFTDALRMEVEHDQQPISITLIKPGAIDTPYVEHAKNFLEVEPKHAPPVYAPAVVAEAILHCAQRPTRDLFVGGSAKALSYAGKVAARFSDRVMEKAMFDQQRTDYPKGEYGGDSLYGPSEDGREYGLYEGRVLESSLYTKMAMNPVLSGIAALGVLSGVIGGIFALSRRM
jgi:NAD(P)-dependent dehydrogenase (short-subunit alcohol dehydrogenase family)